MTCTTACICRCQQSGCGCTENTPTATPRRVVAPTCGLCLEAARWIVVQTPAGDRVTVKFCENCDRKRCKPCGKTEPNPQASRCSSCGVKYP